MPKNANTARAKLLEATMRLSREKEYESLTVREICKQAGVSNGAFYHHYQTKDQLVLEAFLDFDRAITAEMIAHCDSLEPLEALWYIFDNYIDYIVKYVGGAMTEYYRLLLKKEQEGYRDPRRIFLFQMEKHCRRCQNRGFFAKEYSAQQLMELFSRSLRGIIFDWCLCRGGYDLKQQMQKDIGLLIKGLAPKPALQQGAEPGKKISSA